MFVITLCVALIGAFAGLLAICAVIADKILPKCRRLNAWIDALLIERREDHAE